MADSYWAENLRQTADAWGRVEMIVTIVLYGVAVIGLGAILENRTVAIAGAVLGLAIFLSIVLVVTPRRMWEDSQKTIREMRARMEPRLALVFVPGVKPYYQQATVNANGALYLEHMFRLGIRNDSDVVIEDVRVVIESCDPDADFMYIERPLHVMGQNDLRDRCLVSPGDRPTAYVNFLRDLIAPRVGMPSHLRVMYASETLPNIIPDVAYTMVVRVEGGGTFSKRRLTVTRQGPDLIVAFT